MFQADPGAFDACAARLISALPPQIAIADMPYRLHGHWELLFFTGTIGGGFLFLRWPLACIGMMFWMMRGMGGMQHGADHTHSGGTTHSHNDRPTPAHK